jgi:hypothetical protein
MRQEAFRLTPLEDPEQVWQIRYLAYFPPLQVLGPRSIPPEAGKQDVLELPCLMGRFLVRFFRGEWSRRVEECELAKEGVETSLLVSPVDLSLSVHNT